MQWAWTWIQSRRGGRRAAPAAPRLTWSHDCCIKLSYLSSPRPCDQPRAFCRVLGGQGALSKAVGKSGSPPAGCSGARLLLCFWPYPLQHSAFSMQLHEAAGVGNLDELRHLLQAAEPADILAHDSAGNSALHYAAAQGHVAAASLILQAAPAAATANDTQTPISYAAQQGNADVVQLIRQWHQPQPQPRIWAAACRSNMLRATGMKTRTPAAPGCACHSHSW